MSIKQRVKNLEAKSRGGLMSIWVHPAAPIPEHNHVSDDEYFRAKVAERLGHDDFKLCILPASERKEDKFIWIKDVEALKKFISKYTDRVGCPPNPLKPDPGEYEAIAEWARFRLLVPHVSPKISSRLRANSIRR